MKLKKITDLFQWFCLAILFFLGIWFVHRIFFTDHSEEDKASQALADRAIAIAKEKWSPSTAFANIADLRTVSWLSLGSPCQDDPNGRFTEKVMLGIDVMADDMTMRRRYFYFCVETKSAVLFPSDLVAKQITSLGSSP